MTTGQDLTSLLAGGALFECPRWHDDAWWVSDIYARRVIRVSEAGEQATIMEIGDGGRPSGLGWSPKGDLLVVINNHRQVLRLHPTGDIVVHTDAGDQLASHGNFNDMVVAPDGRAFVSNMGAGNVDLARTGIPSPTCVTVIEPDGRHHDEGHDLNFPNGMVLTPDARTLIVSETGARRLTAFTVADNGALSDRRTWAELSDGDHWPDGCCQDADGAIWTASPRGHTGWLRVVEGGKILDRISVGRDVGAYACALGGSRSPTLLLCARRHTPGLHAAQSQSSMLLTARAPRAGAGYP